MSDDQRQQQTPAAAQSAAIAPRVQRPLSVDEKAYAKRRIEAIKAGIDPEPPPDGIRLTQRRVPVLSESLIDEIRKMIHAGAPPEIAAQAQGIPVRVFRGWLDLGRAEIGDLYVQLLAVVERAEAIWEVDCNTTIALGKKGWQSRAWQLERRRSETYALKTKQEISGPSGGPVVIAPGKLQLPPLDADEDLDDD